MKNYKATKENPIFKKGTKFKYDGDGSPMYMSGHGIDIDLFYEWMEKGYIKEVQKKEFTESDMIDLIRFNLNSVEWTPKQVFNDWKKQRNR